MKEFGRRTLPVYALAGGLLLGLMFFVLPARASSNAALPLAVPAGVKLVVGDQNENLQTALAVSGVKEKLATKVQFANFLGGPAILEAFRAGALDVALVGSTPPIHAHAAGEELPIVAALKSTKPAYRFALRPGLKLNSLQDLKGKKIAWAEGTARQPFVLSALKLAGLKTTDVKLISLRAGDFPDAVRTGQVDVAALNEPHFSRYLANYADEKASALPDAAHAGLPTTMLYLYASRKALNDPAKAAAIRELVAGWITAVDWTSKNRGEWVKVYYVKRQNLKEADGLNIVKSEGDPDFPPLSVVVREQQGLIDLIHSAGQLPKRLDAREEFDFRFDAVISETLTRLKNAG